MSFPSRLVLLLLGGVMASCSGDSGLTSPSTTQPAFSFFVTSVTSTTGNLGGIRGADATCQRLALATGNGRRTWRAYLSVDQDPDNGNRATDARSRIGNGPWYNRNLVMVAKDVAELHARTGDANVFLDEEGRKINGQWGGSPTPNQHDVLTGSTADGTLMPGMTCADWTSESTSIRAMVGHSDGMGPNMSTAGTLSSWNAAHLMSSNCSNTAPGGGAGRFYCFARE